MSIHRAPLQLFALAFLLLLNSATHGQNGTNSTTHFYLPVIQSAGTSSLGIALTNPTLEPAEIKLMARSYRGEPISGAEINNPATITLSARGQRALQMTEVFGRGISGVAGWVDITSSTPGVKGFFTLFDDALTAIEGASFGESPSSNLNFPKVTPDTNIVFINTSAQAIEGAAFSLFDNSGRVLQKKQFTIAAYSGFSGPLSDLIPEAGGFSGYAELNAAGTIFSSAQQALVGFETYRNRADIAALSAIPLTGAARDAYIPHFVSQGGYYTNLGLINPTSQSQRVRISTDAPGSGSPVERIVPAAARIEEGVDQLFGFTGDATIAGYIHYEVQGDGNGLIGYAEYGTTDGLLLSAATAQSARLSDIFFSQIAEGGGFYTGLALLNPNTIPSSVIVDAFDEKGRRLGSTAVTVEAGARYTRLFKEFFPAIANQSGGYIHLSAARGIFATELFGASSSANVLANVPAQGVQLQAQGSGRSVFASKGANVLSSDGSASISIPPGALARDTEIWIDAMRFSDLPNPASDQRVAGAVNGEPAGVNFKMPVKVTFPLGAQLPRDSSLPLLLFNPQTRRYDPTEFTALVDESGRTASADITHFSTFVVSLPDRELLNVTGIAPSSGSAGTIATINGEGFSPTAENVVTFAGPDNTSKTAPVTAATANALTVTVPAGAVTGYVTVRTGARTSLGLVFNVQQDQPKPSITSISPASVLTGAPTRELEIAGTGFRPASKVLYDDTNIPATYVDPTLLLIAPESAQLKPAIHRIAVTNAPPGGGTSNAVEFTVAYPAPSLSSVIPFAFDEGDTGDVTFNGAGFTSETIAVVDGVLVKPAFLGPNALSLSRISFQTGSHSVSVSNPSPGGGVSNALTLLVRPKTVRVAAILLLEPVSGRAVSELVVNEGNTIRPEVLIVDTTGSINRTFNPALTSLDTAVAAVDSLGNIQGKRAGFSTLIVNAGGAIAIFTVTVVGVDTGPGGFTVTGITQDLARHIYLAATQDQTVLLLEDLKKDPAIYAGVRQTPGLKNDVRLQSWFKNPAFLTLNQAEGSLYVADAANNMIRRVSAGNSGKVETLAGTGATGSLDGPAGSATFNNPQGVVLDATGHVWITDSDNHTIRRIDLISKTVQTIAGQAGAQGLADGRGTAARFRSPMGLAVETETAAQQLARERAGLPPPPVRVIVADSGNGAIRRVTENGDVETLQVFSTALTQLDGKISQSPATTFNSPTGVAVDPLGNIYVTESSAGTVKTILTNGSVVSAVQPNTFVNPRGIAITQTGRAVVSGSNRAAQELRFGPPQITSITPARAPNTGGTRVTVLGSNFAPGSVLLVGGVIISQARVENTQRITFTTPALPSGVTTVTVQNRGGIAQQSWVVDPIPLALIPPGQITTIAGGATFVGDGVNAKSAALQPWKAVLDTFGDIYFVDYTHHRVRKISSTTGIIITVAGTGEADFKGDGGLATAAMLKEPEGLAIDAAGDLFIADSGNQRIRKVSMSSGIITTVAGDGASQFAGDGGAATSASLASPADVALDSAGNIFIADSGNNRIRRVGPNGIISTIAGNGLTETGIPADNVTATTAAMNFPLAVLTDGAGNVIVADTYTHTVRKIGTDGKIHTIAGNGSAGSATNQLNSPYGLALDASGNLFIADSGNERIRRLDASSNAITNVAGTGQAGFSGDNGAATSAKLALPIGLAVNASGDILIADAMNLRLRKVAAATNVITTIAGNGEFGYLGDSQPATAAGLNFPQGIAFDANGNLYVADTNRIRRITAATGIITTIAGTGERGYSPDGTAAAAAFLNVPTGIVIDSAGNIFFAETGNNIIRKVNANTGTLVTVAGNLQASFSGDNGPATSAALNGPALLAFDNNQSNLYFADSGNNRIRKVNLSSGVISTVAGNGVGDFTGDGGPATSAALNNPVGVALDSTNNLFISDRLNGLIRKVTAATGIITTYAGVHTDAYSVGFAGDGGPATQALMNYPLGLAFDSQGNLFISDAGNARVRRVARSTNIIVTVAGNGQAGLGLDNVLATSSPLVFPLALQFDGNGNLFFTDPSTVAARIRAVKAPIP